MKACLALSVLLGFACGSDGGHELSCDPDFVNPNNNPIYQGGGAHLSAYAGSDGAPCIAFAKQNGDIVVSCEHNGRFDGVDVGGKVEPDWFGRSIGLIVRGLERYVFFWDAVGGGLKVADETEKGFSIDTIDPDEKAGVDLSVAVHGDDFYVAYLDMGEHDLRFAKGRVGAFNITTLDAEGAVGNDPSIAVDDNGVAHICYYGCGEFSLSGCEGELRYIALGTVPQVIDHGDDAGWYCSIALDATSLPHIAYHVHKKGELRYAFQDKDKQWHVNIVDSVPSAGAFAVLVLDGQSPLIAYSKEGINGVVLARHDALDTFTQKVVNIGKSPAKHCAFARVSRCKLFLGWFDERSSALDAILVGAP